MKTVFFFIAAFLLAANLAGAQDSKRPSRSFQLYKIDTLHIKGDPEQMKKNVIAIQKQEAIKSAFWDEKDGVLTVEYDDDQIDMPIIKAFFVANLTTKTLVIVVKMKKT